MRDPIPPADRLPSSTPRASARPVIILAGILAVFLGAAASYSYRVWSEIGDTNMSASGDVALVIGVVVATVLGAGLMGLVFYSSRRGYDDDAGASVDYELPPAPANDESHRPAA
jgi:hypothetical protein